ncbi:translation initiation factor eIF 4e-like domain-containing protein [Hyaloraphidium curvatum]|nr:translation initiation factor eIF 4e-like domain-containing protein [Hyaloraphidium curvatum]
MAEVEASAPADGVESEQEALKSVLVSPEEVPYSPSGEEIVRLRIAGLAQFNVKHPLQYSWTLWYDSPAKRMTTANWSQNLKKLISFDTVEVRRVLGVLALDFWGVYNNIIKASDLTAGSNYHFFKTGVQPMWEGSVKRWFSEDPANSKGGKWTLNVPRNRKAELDLLWLYTMLGLIGQTLEDSNEITGAVVSIRAKGDRIAIWTKTAALSAADKEVQEKIARAWKQELSVPDTEQLGYLPHAEASAKAPKDAYTV